APTPLGRLSFRQNWRVERVFLLSPAHCGGARARLVFRPDADFELARRLRSEGGAPLGEVFSFLSGLYFRGKLAYARAFARPPAKYRSILGEVFGSRLLFPPAFVGRGDMSRGGLMLRAARSGEELPYISVLGAVWQGPRPPKLEALLTLSRPPDRC